MTSIPRFFLCCAVALCAAPRFVTAEEGAAAAVPASLNKGDALLIRIEGMGGGLPEYREIVDSDGNIDLPFLGFHLAEGKSIPSLEAEMAAAYVEANLATTASVRITYATHFEPPPDRANLVRAQDPRRPVPAQTIPSAPE